MWGPMSLEEYAEKLGEDLSRRPMPLTGLEDLPDMGALRTARKGDSISSILGSSDPAAIGVFMDVNGMKDSRLRVGESYLIPRRADLADQSMAGRGQAALNADNARAVERARRTILPGDAVTVRPVAAVFDPQKGILATRPQSVTVQPRPGDNSARGSTAAQFFGEGTGLFDVQNGVLGLKDQGRAAAKIRRVTGPLGTIADLVENGLEGVTEYNKGAPGADVAVGVLGKTAIKGIASGAGGVIGTFTGPFAPAAIPLFAYAGGKAADYFLDGKSNAAVGRKLRSQMEELGRNSYGYDAF